MAEQGHKRYFRGNCARILGEMLRAERPEFDVDGYEREVESLVDPLELKDRVLVLAKGLRSRLPDDYPTAVDNLLAILGPELKEGEGMFNSSYFLMPVARFVEEWGLDHPAKSYEAMYEITKRHTAEYAIRPFLAAYQDETLAHAKRWAQDESLNVRRLSSEGIRPRLPWASRHLPFIENPEPIIPVLDLLIDDPSPYVRKSVANNLNDISKDNRDVAIDVAGGWLERSPGERTRWIVRHGLRNLIKAGDAEALELQGVSTDNVDVMVKEFEIAPASVQIGDAVEMTVSLVNRGDDEATVVVDYVVHYPRLKGGTSSKVFKMKSLELRGGEDRLITKRHIFRDVTSRTHQPGPHRIDLQVNGLIVGSAATELRLVE